MNHILTERLRLSVPDEGNLEGHAAILGLRLDAAGKSATDAERASALSDFGFVKGRHLQLAIWLTDYDILVGWNEVTINLDAFTTTEVTGKNVHSRDKPLEIALRLYVKPKHRGKGYAFEAARAFVDYAFAVLRASPTSAL